MQNYIHRGETLTVTAPYALLSGGGCRVGNIFGISVNTQNSGDSSEIRVVGVFDLAKDGSTFNEGDLVYWDDTNKVATSTVGANLLIGAAGLIQASGINAPGGNTSDPTVRVRLFGVPGFSGQANGLKVAHFLYNFAVDGGASCTPANSDTIPANAVVFGGAINSTTAVTAAGAATVAIGTSAGSAGNSILTATGKATLSLDALVVPTCAGTPFKTSAAGQIAITVATGPLTAGVIEGWVLYAVANNS
jgi:predicted RecA/RadA family phage recombinase